MQVRFLPVLLFAVFPVFVLAQSLENDQVPADFIRHTTPHTLNSAAANAAGGVLGNRSTSSQLGIDSIPNWSSYFYFPGINSFGGQQFTWQYTMVGRSPFAKDGENKEGQTTWIGAPVVPVNLDLRNYDGSPRFVNGKRLYSDATEHAESAVKSPVFSLTSYSSSRDETQFTDAVQRAEFFHQSGDEWHTLLHQRITTPRTLVLPRGSYHFALNADGSCCAYVLIDFQVFVPSFFPPTPTDTTTPIGAAENSGDIHTGDLASFLLPDAYLYVNDDPNQCCILGFHTYDVEPGSQANGWREKRYVLNYSSWISPGLFGAGFSDVTAMSHEIAEIYNDPFVSNATPWWLSPNGNCQNNLEEGDVIEGLPNGTYPITLNGTTWHPQNEALLQWFAGVTPSSAIDGAYSYPDTTVLTAASTSRNFGCL